MLKSGFGLIHIKEEKKMEEHVIIIGYGFSGKNLARSTREAGVPYMVLDMNPEHVRRERRRGVPIYFGDGTREQVLKHVNIEKAKVVAVVVNDPIASLRIVDRARRLNKDAYIVVRTQFLEEMQAMFQMGADDVIPDEFGSSLEIFTRVLQKYDTPIDQVERLVAELRAEGYEMMRHRFMESTIFSGLKEYITDVSTNTLVVGKKSPLIGKTLEEIQLRKKYGLTVIVIRRKEVTLYNIDAHTKLYANDLVVVMGTNENIIEATELFLGI